MYRHELKYVIDPFTALIIGKRMQLICKYDEHADKNGFYRVTSLYFDDYNNTALNDNLIGKKDRQKFRIRIYDNKDDFIRLEKKVKNNQVGFKKSEQLTRLQYENILSGNYDALIAGAQPLLKTFCTMARTKKLKPKVIVDYYRQSFVYDFGTVRITMDHQVKFALGKIDLFADNPIFAPVTSERDVILEVKYTGYLPSVIRDVVQQSISSRQSISKYTLCRSFSH